MTDTELTLTGVHHLAITVTDIEASAAWYERVLGMNRLPVTFPHFGCEDTGYAVLMITADMSVAIGLHHHESNDGKAFDETRTGLDHLGMQVADRASLEAWASRLDTEGVDHSGIQDVTEPMPFSTLVFRDPDNIQLEFFAQ